MNLTPEERERLIITACGPIMILPKDLGFFVQNLISEGDWCSMFCNRGQLKDLDEARKIANIRILPQMDGFKGPFKDQFFLSETYQYGNEKYGVPWYEEFGNRNEKY